MSYTDRLRDEPEKLVKDYSILPVDYPVGFKAHDEALLSGKFSQYKHTLVGDNQNISYVSAVKCLHTNEYNARKNEVVLSTYAKTQDMNAATDAETKFRAKFMSNERGTDALKILAFTSSGPDRIPAYFLPWDPSGAAVELTIPDKAADAPENQHPKLFLTAVLSGCSIFFKGTAQNPTIYHCGTQGDTSGASAKAFWAELMSEAGKTDRGRQGAVQAEVHNVDYMYPKRGATGQGVADAKTSQAKLERHYKDRFLIEKVDPWGTVLGIRKGTNWQFYLQENISVTYWEFEDVPGPMKVRTLKNQRTHARPAIVRPIFPGGGGAVKALESWKTLRP